MGVKIGLISTRLIAIKFAQLATSVYIYIYIYICKRSFNQRKTRRKTNGVFRTTVDGKVRVSRAGVRIFSLVRASFSSRVSCCEIKTRTRGKRRQSNKGYNNYAFGGVLIYRNYFKINSLENLNVEKTLLLYYTYYISFV